MHTEMHKPGLPVLSHQTDKRVDLCSSDVFLQQLAIVVEQSCDRVLSQDIIANLFLHKSKLFGDVLLRDRRINSLSTQKPKQRLTVGEKNYIITLQPLSLTLLCLYSLLILSDTDHVCAGKQRMFTMTRSPPYLR